MSGLDQGFDGDRRKELAARLKREGAERMARWRAARDRRDSALKELTEAVTRVRARLAEIERGKQLASFYGVTLYERCLEFSEETYPLLPGVKAKIERSGGVATAQGWAMKTTQDRREAVAVFEGPDWYFELSIYNGATTSTDAGAMVQNVLYRTETGSAAGFVAKVNSAARRVPEVEARDRAVVSACRADMLAVYRAAPGLGEAEAAEEELQALLAGSRHADDARRELRAAFKGRGFGPSSWGLRAVDEELKAEQLGYSKYAPADIAAWRSWLAQSVEHLAAGGDAPARNVDRPIEQATT